MTSTPNDPLGFLPINHPDFQNDIYADIIQSLLCEIARVKELIKNYNSFPDEAGKTDALILNELVLEAYESLISYDIALMKKYYDLLQNCD